MRLIDADTLKAEFTGNFQNEYTKAEIHALIDLAPTIGGWISVTDKEKLPKGECIAYSSKFDEMMIGYIGEAQDSDTGYCAENEGEFLYDVTHWMPKPKPPKEK